jgi:DtxR family Mn-dependent transcriptional regulator
MDKTMMNDASHWREFEQNPLSHSMAHYLMAIDSLREELGYARSTDVAEMLEVSRGAASMALNQLKKRGWVAEDPNRFLLLTEEGKQIASQVENNFLILSKFFQRVLGVPSEIALGDACKMEHLMNHETAQRLLWLTRYLLISSDVSHKIKRRMANYDTQCDDLSTEECPVCGATDHCLASTPEKS